MAAGLVNILKICFQDVVQAFSYCPSHEGQFVTQDLKR